LHGAAAAVGEQRERNMACIAGGHLDPLHRPAQAVGHDHRRHGLVALTLRRRAHVDVGDPVLIYAQPRRLAPAEAGRLDAARNADAGQAAAGLGSFADSLEGQLEELGVVAAVVYDAAATARQSSRVWDLL